MPSRVERTCVLYDGGMEWLYTSQPVRLRLSVSGRRALWALRRQQDQAFNMGVELALTQEPGERVPTPFTAWKRLTAWRADGTLPRHGVALQRAGVAAGVDAVRKWRLARRECEHDAAYWTGRAGAEDASPRVLRKAARAARRLERHVAAGTKRLYRSRKHIERSGGPALVILESARLAEGAVVLPGARGETPLRLPLAGPFAPPGGWEWTGAVQIVDITDRKGRVTRRTRPGHRSYMARAILRAPAPQAVEPERIDEVLGVDAGVAVTAYGSDGSQHHMPGEAEATAAIKDAQRRRARCDRGSRRHDKRGRRLATMQRRRANRRRNARRHIAKAVVTTPGIRAVAVEDLSLRKMLRSAKGTPEQPGTNVRAKSGLNRSMSRAGLSELHTFIEQTCRLLGVAFCPVHAAGTSLTCHGCGAPGIRETQADFYCPECDRRCNADPNAALNIRRRAYPQLEADMRPGRSPSAGGGTPPHHRHEQVRTGPVMTGTTVYKPLS